MNVSICNILGVLHDNTNQLVQLDRVRNNPRRRDCLLQCKLATRRGATNRRRQLVLHGLHAHIHSARLSGHVPSRTQRSASLVRPRRSAHVRRSVREMRRCSTWSVCCCHARTNDLRNRTIFHARYTGEIVRSMVRTWRDWFSHFRKSLLIILLAKLVIEFRDFISRYKDRCVW